MKTFTIKTLLLATLLMISESAFGTQISIGIQIGPPPPPPVVYLVPSRPSPEYVWVEGYWYPTGKTYRWRDGYWVRPPYGQAVWAAPRYSDGRYFGGYWYFQPRPIKPGNAWGHDKGPKSQGNGRGRGHR